MKHVFTTGTFNLITPGHVDFLRRAKDLGDKLTVFVDSDARNKQLKPEKCFFSLNDRAEILSSIKYVDQVYEMRNFTDVSSWLDGASASYEKVFDTFLFVKGRDYNVDSLDPDLLQRLDKKGVPIAFIPLLEGYSTSRLVEKIVAANGQANLKKAVELVPRVSGAFPPNFSTIGKKAEEIMKECAKSLGEHYRGPYCTLPKGHEGRCNYHD